MTEPRQDTPESNRDASRSERAFNWEAMTAILGIPAAAAALIGLVVSLGGGESSAGEAGGATTPSVPATTAGETTTRGGVEEPVGGSNSSTPTSDGRAVPPSSTIATPPLAPMYSQAAIGLELDKCGRDDDIDLDVPEHPHLESAAEIDFSSCMQGYTYIVGKNGAVISSAAPTDATPDQCIQAVEEEPGSDWGIEIEAGLVVCVVDYDESGTMRVFRLVIEQFSGSRPTSIVLTAVGWR